MTRNEVPRLTAALLAVTQGQALVEGLMVGEVPCIRIHNNGGPVNVLVRSEDWAKIIPYLKDGTLSTALLPVAKPVPLHPNTHNDTAVGEIWNSELYNRIQTLLNKLFTTEFPTSNL
jgi:hypothetical protein